jgi:cell division protein FtsB
MKQSGTRRWVAVFSALAGAALALSPAARAQDEKKSLEQQLQEQQARNEALRQRIAELEKILATDVCTNPEAAAALAAPQGTEPKRP